MYEIDIARGTAQYRKTGTAWDFGATLQGTCAVSADGPLTMEAQDWGGNGFLDNGDTFQ